MSKPKKREHWNKVARVNEKEINAFFLNFCNWESIAPNTDIMGGGIDNIFLFFNSFSNKNEIILLESKHKVGSSISSTDLEEQIKKLKTQIESFRKKENNIKEAYEEIENLEGSINKGILFHRFEAFSKEKFDENLLKVKLGKKRQYNPPTIYFLNNYQIARFAELYREANRVNLYWYYPSFGLNFSSIFFKSPIPTYLLSEIGLLLPVEEIKKDIYQHREIKEESLIFYSFESPIVKVCEYIKSFFKQTPLNPSHIKQYFFFKGNHAEKETYLNNFRRLNIPVRENQLMIYELNDSQIPDFEMIFKK